MATDPRKRQKKLERRASKRKEKHHSLTRAQPAGLPGRLTAAARFPVLDCWVMEDLWTEGMGQVLLSRKLPDGTVAVAAFLVDRYCLGVKNALAVVVNQSTYTERFVRQMRSRFEVRDISPAAVRKLVEAAVAYARGLGFSPHADYQRAKLLFGDIDAAECAEEFEFGKDGKPLFINGPNDTPERCRQIVNTLTHSCGPGGFDYLVIGPGSDLGIPDSLGWDSDDEDDEDPAALAE